MSRLIVVSNRVTPLSGAKAAAAGGLAVGLLATLRETGGIWFGWSGETPEQATTLPKVFRSGNVTYITLDLAERDFDDYYGGFANRTLWPLFHYRLDLSSFDRDWYNGYRRVNRLFAEQLFPYVRDDDLIWIHDYHLIPMAEELRRLGLKAKIGFFLHIPFPAWEVYVTLPWHEQLMRALCMHDLLGFQTENESSEFPRLSLPEGIGYALDNGMAQVGDHRLKARTYPIGIDVDDFAEMATSVEARRSSERLSRSLLGRNLIIGVDRLDYTKGIVERLRAYETLLQDYPNQRGQVTFVQISQPSRQDVPEYLELRHQVEAASGRINGRFNEYDWMPLRYINRGFTRRTLSGFFRLSRVGLVTPLRDGMNLVAKEYVAAQDGKDPGMLVLSRFAGAARELDAALIVNPFDVEAMAEAMHQGLIMPLEERRARWTQMMEVLRRNDISAWHQRFVAALRPREPDLKRRKLEIASG
ncbi:MAG: alpha,alpha-trehalose-phosphate synthase (UDP-forming) [Rhizobiales bacterium]|nr:alpha,alpha-trehalose-phosphate synthase (UDP-forming) [Hyphomicrobiales bacterium]